MTATPRHRSQQAEQEELARMLPAAADPELSLRRHLLLKEHLMDTVTENSRRSAKRRTLALRVALPLGLAATVAGVALTSGTGRSVAPNPGVAAAGGQSPGSITNAAYTLQSSSDDLVKLTILDWYQPVDTTQLQHDLDRFGVRSRVYAGEPGCHAPEPESPSYPPDAAVEADRQGSQGRLSYYGWDMGSEGLKEVLTIRPSAIPADLQLFIYLPLAKTDPANGSRELQAGLMKSPAPSCMPSKTYDNPLASLYPTPAPTH
ncbi:hypothetical protein [Kitasatospora sp. NPDC050463]|uniref:hypothetical protein n=1 Tax=Kitasatospora sp. NPDC050463 TaxID=3155786 RepID=UPI0033F22C58